MASEFVTMDTLEAKIEASAMGVRADFRAELNRLLMWLAAYHLASIVAIVTLVSSLD